MRAGSCESVPEALRERLGEDVRKLPLARDAERAAPPEEHLDRRALVGVETHVVRQVLRAREVAAEGRRG